MDNPLDTLTLQLREFAAARNWEQFHSPKNLASALSVEAAELLEHFQWLTEEQSRDLDLAQKKAVGQELADVLLYLLQLADKLGLDLADEAQKKLGLNAVKYPVLSEAMLSLPKRKETMHTTLTSKGQMTLPSAVRTQLGLEAGDQLLVTVQGSDTIILKRRPSEPAARLRGLLPRPKRARTVQEMDAGIAAHLGAKHRPGNKP